MIGWSRCANTMRTKPGSSQLSGASRRLLGADYLLRHLVLAKPIIEPQKRAHSPSAQVRRTGIFNFWCRGPESNWGHADFQSAALPTELPRHRVSQLLEPLALVKIFLGGLPRPRRCAGEWHMLQQSLCQPSESSVQGKHRQNRARVPA